MMVGSKNILIGEDVSPQDFLNPYGALFVTR